MPKINTVMREVMLKKMREDEEAKRREAQAEDMIPKLMSQANVLAGVVLKMKEIIVLLERPLKDIAGLIREDANVGLEEVERLFNEVNHALHTVGDIFGDEDEDEDDENVHFSCPCETGDQSYEEGVCVYGGEKAEPTIEAPNFQHDDFQSMLSAALIAAARRQGVGFSLKPTR